MKTKVLKQKITDDTFQTTAIGVDAINVDVEYTDPSTQEVSIENLQDLIDEGKIGGGGSGQWIDI